MKQVNNWTFSFLSIGLAIAGFSSLATAQDRGLSVDVELFTDFRLGLADGEQTWLDQGLGKGRFGGDANGNTKADFQIAEIAALVNVEFNWEWSAFVHAKYDETQDGPIDFVEAFVKYSPTPTSSTRYNFRAGLFFPHISRENVGVAWSSPYTITPSAINSWVGEEIRTLGLEAKVSFRGEVNQIDLTAAAFGFNDASGTLLAFRGWALNDVKATAFTQLPLAPLPQIGLDSTFVAQPLWVEPVAEIDESIGFYGAIDWTYDRNWKAGAFYYDNRADPDVIEQEQYGWWTRFWNFYIEGDTFADIHLIAQYMTGNTTMGRVVPAFGTRYIDMDFTSGFILATRKFGRQRLSARFDWFDTADNAFVQRDNNNEAGAAITVAHSYEFSRKSTLIAEYMFVDSKRIARRDLGGVPDQQQSIFQIAYRHRF